MWVNGACVSTFKTDTVLNVPATTELYFELVLDSPKNIEAVNLRMGGSVAAPSKCEKKNEPCKKSEMPDMDFDHTLDDAELQFGHGIGPGSGGSSMYPACAKYESADGAVGREVFWRSPQSRPAVDVKCIRVAIKRAQQRPLIIRGLHVRSAHARTFDSSASKSSDESGNTVSHEKPSGLVHTVLTPSSLTSADTFAEQHFAWILLVSVAFVSGAFAGVLGCLVSAAGHAQIGRRRRSH